MARTFFLFLSKEKFLWPLFRLRHFEYVSQGQIETRKDPGPLQTRLLLSQRRTPLAVVLFAALRVRPRGANRNQEGSWTSSDEAASLPEKNSSGRCSVCGTASTSQRGK